MDNSEKKMRLFGIISSNVAFLLKRKFEEADIFCKCEEPGGLLSMSMSGVSVAPKMKLFIEEKSYDKAMQIVRDYDKDMEQKVAVDGKKANGQMIWVLFGFLILVGLMIYFVLR
jgi:hypothetical protein